jgi:hypothetical protein
MSDIKKYLKLFTSKFPFILKCISYFYVFNKALKFIIMLFRFISYLFTGSFIAAFMVLYDFTAEINDFWIWLISIKDYLLSFIIDIYSRLISPKDINSPSNKSGVKENDVPKPKSHLEHVKGSFPASESEARSHNKSLRNDNGYKHSIPESDASTPLHKDWRENTIKISKSQKMFNFNILLIKNILFCCLKQFR